MGLFIEPALPQTASPLGATDFNWSNPAVPLSGPAPAASAAPVVGGTSLALPNVGMPSPVVAQNALGVTPTGMDAMSAPSVPTADGLGWGDMRFMDKANVVLGGIGTLGKIWSAFQANKIARESLDFQKRAFDTNLANQRASYNVALEDRANSRASYAGTPEARAAADAYINKHSI